MATDNVLYVLSLNYAAPKFPQIFEFAKNAADATRYPRGTQN
jgi:hypothetical protein